MTQTKTDKAITARELIKILRQNHDALDLPVYFASGDDVFTPLTRVRALGSSGGGDKFFVKAQGRRHHTKGFLLK